VAVLGQGKLGCSPPTLSVVPPRNWACQSKCRICIGMPWCNAATGWDVIPGQSRSFIKLVEEGLKTVEDQAASRCITPAESIKEPGLNVKISCPRQDEEFDIDSAGAATTLPILCCPTVTVQRWANGRDLKHRLSALNRGIGSCTATSTRLAFEPN
jgi:hypothetical protein